MAALLEVARQLAGERPARSVLFLAFCSEEQLMLGSYHYVAHPLRPLATTRAVLDLRAVLEETAAMLRAIAEQAGVTLEVSGAKAAVTGDSDRLREVATDLLSNAIRYNRPDDRAAASTRVEGTEAVLEVSDTGPGIPEKDRPHIFERFYRVDKARSREAGCSGLGLSITRRIVEAHGGTVAFASREGEGTTVTVRLPRASVP